MAKRCKYRGFILILLLFTGVQALKAVPVKQVSPSPEKDYSGPSSKTPFTEPDRHHLALSVSFTVSPVKYETRAELLTIWLVDIPQDLYRVPATGHPVLPAKEYLLHIYPSHNFW